MPSHVLRRFTASPCLACEPQSSHVSLSVACHAGAGRPAGGLPR